MPSNLYIRNASRPRLVKPGHLTLRSGSANRKVIQGWVKWGSRWRTFYQGSSPQTKSFYAHHAYTGWRSGSLWKPTTSSGREGFLYEGQGSHPNESGAVYFDAAAVKALLSTRRKTTKIRIRLHCLWTYAGSGKDFHLYATSVGPGAAWGQGRHIANVHLTRGQTAWVNLPTWVGDGMRDGTITAITTIYTGSSSHSYWGFLTGTKTGSVSSGTVHNIGNAPSSQKPLLEITADYG